MSVSVIIPCHNAESWIGDALTSIAKQTIPVDQVIVIDDASSDNSLNAVRSADVATDVLQVNCGNAAATRNVGLQIANTDWVAFLDADNIWYPWHLEIALQLLEASGDIACMSYPGEVPFVLESPSRAKGVPFDRPTSALPDLEFIRLRLEGGYGFPTTGQVLQTGRVKAVGGFDESQRRRHDFELFMRVIHRASWSFQPVASWWSRPPRSGDISSDKAACKLFALRALELNTSRYTGRDMAKLLRREARNAYAEAVRSGSLRGRSDAFRAARHHLGYLETCFVGLKARVSNYQKAVRWCRGATSV